MTIGTIMLTAALLCREVALDHAPILYAVRNPPIHPADSGWQYLCGGVHEDACSTQLWSLGEVLNYDSSLGPFVDLPTGTILERSNGSETWIVVSRAMSDDWNEAGPVEDGS
jgi:hypothetical protein